MKYLPTVKEYLQRGIVPSCSTPDQFNTWVDLHGPRHPIPKYFCEDCTDSYQDEMIKQGKCDKY